MRIEIKRVHDYDRFTDPANQKYHLDIVTEGCLRTVEIYCSGEWAARAAAMAAARQYEAWVLEQMGLAPPPMVDDTTRAILSIRALLASDLTKQDRELLTTVCKSTLDQLWGHNT
jgi:hypothetical protein